MANSKEFETILFILLLCSCFHLNDARSLNDSASSSTEEFWKTNIIYQIYPRSFYDSNGDGVGDLAGIASKADYFKDLGVGTIWLSPIYKSPMADFGYDISDFKDVDPIFGTMEDFDELLEEMHSRDIKVLLDFVPNHSSDEHEWFQKSLQNDPQYKDYYIWKDPAGFNESGDPIPPNNWLSIFRFSAWEWSPEREQFYFHQFLKKQPDLNFRNPKVMQEMEDVIRFWLDKGVDGFRVDAIIHLFEVEDVYGKDESVDVDSGVSDPTQYKYLKHIYTIHQPETFTVLNQWMELLDEYENKFMMLEVYDTDVVQVMRYYGNDSFPVSHFPFNFLLIENLRDRSSLTGASLMEVVELWLESMPEERWPNWVLGNHDNSRVSTRLGTNLVDALNMLTLLLPGTPVTYYGEEIGMEDAFISFEDTQDPSGCNDGPDNYMESSRDPERTPMQWDDSPFAGFTEGNSTWLTVNDNYVTLNVKSEMEAEQSHLKVYKQLAELRQNDAFRYGDVEFQLATDDAVAFMRNFQDQDKFVVVINTSEEENTIDLTRGLLEFPETGTVVIRSSTDSRPETNIGSVQNLSSVVLLPGEGMVLDITEKSP